MLFALITISLYNLSKSSYTVKLYNSQSTFQLWLKYGTHSFMTAIVCYISADIQNVIGNNMLFSRKFCFMVWELAISVYMSDKI